MPYTDVWRFHRSNNRETRNSHVIVNTFIVSKLELLFLVPSQFKQYLLLYKTCKVLDTSYCYLFVFINVVSY